MNIYINNVIVEVYKNRKAGEMEKEPEKRKYKYNPLSNRKWDAKNKEHRQYLNKKGATKSFILNLANPDDLELVREWLKERTNKDI